MNVQLSYGVAEKLKIIQYVYGNRTARSESNGVSESNLRIWQPVKLHL